MEGNTFKNTEANDCIRISVLSVKRKDLILLFAFYNISYFLSWALIRSDLKVCFLIAFLISLFSILLFTIISLFEKINEEEHKIVDDLTLKQLKDEYQRIYKIKRRNQLLKKAKGSSQEEGVENLIDDPMINIETSGSTPNAVHFNFLNRHGTARLHSDKP